MKRSEIKSCTGTGLLALDILFRDDDFHNPQIYAGGSMGNVQLILAFLGWDTFPIARLAKDFAADEIKADLSRWGVNTDFVFTSEDGSTPVIIQRNYIDKSGNPKHKFQFRCPIKNEWFPSYKSIIRDSLDLIINNHEESNIYYFDRATRANIDLAKYYSSVGALVFFEPASIPVERLFIEALKVAHIVKLSDERIKNYESYQEYSNAILEIVTLGSNGLVYKRRDLKYPKWIFLEGYQLRNIQDTSGAGDWFSASLINSLGVNALEKLLNLSDEELYYYFQISQAYSAINCQFDGARGSMYNLHKTTLNQLVNELHESKTIPSLIIDNESITKKDYMEIINLLTN